MASILSRHGRLRLDFHYRGIRCRELLRLQDTPQNRKRAAQLLEQIKAEILLDQFDYCRYFPGSSRAKLFRDLDAKANVVSSVAVKFVDFAQQWFNEKRVEWRERHQEYESAIIRNDLIPVFGQQQVDRISKGNILEFRSSLVQRPGQKAETIGASRVNHIMNTLRMILEEAADRFDFKSPWRRIKPLAVKREDVHPFTLNEAMQMIDAVRPDYRSYLVVRFFTGLRTGEVNGLQWRDIDFDRKEINVSRAFSEGKLVPLKTSGSRRSIRMTSMVREALMAKKPVSPAGDAFVFCSPTGLPVDNRNFRRRVWVPLLKHLGLEERSPYQTRHTAASLWLAVGENPEWIAMQLGHTTTEMLFRIYSRYVPNLTRRDGSAFDALVERCRDANDLHTGSTPVSVIRELPSRTAPDGSSSPQSVAGMEPAADQTAADRIRLQR